MSKSCQKWQNSDFQSKFSMSKNIRIFPIFFFIEILILGHIFCYWNFYLIIKITSNILLHWKRYSYFLNTVPECLFMSHTLHQSQNGSWNLYSYRLLIHPTVACLIVRRLLISVHKRQSSGMAATHEYWSQHDAHLVYLPIFMG